MGRSDDCNVKRLGQKAPCRWYGHLTVFLHDRGISATLTQRMMWRIGMSYLDAILPNSYLVIFETKFISRSSFSLLASYTPPPPIFLLLFKGYLDTIEWPFPSYDPKWRKEEITTQRRKDN